jgi:hypothetical protein
MGVGVFYNLRVFFLRQVTYLWILLPLIAVGIHAMLPSLV